MVRTSIAVSKFKKNLIKSQSRAQSPKTPASANSNFSAPVKQGSLDDQLENLSPREDSIMMIKSPGIKS